MKIYEHRLVKIWSIDMADYWYRLEFRRPMKDRWSLLSSGDEEWAKRTANHYGIKVPTESLEGEV